MDIKKILFAQVRIKFGRFFSKALRLAEFHSDIVEGKYRFLKWSGLTFIAGILLLCLVLWTPSNNVSSQSFSDGATLIAPVITRLAVPVIARLVLYLIDSSFSWKDEF